MKKTILLLVSAILLTGYLGFASPYYVSGDCMEPAFKDGQNFFVNRLYKYFGTFQKGDVVAFQHEGKIWFSRIVALENDSIHITDKNIAVNDSSNESMKIQRNWENWEHGSYALSSPYQVPAGSVFVLSDNLSAHHDDSRVFGPISKDLIVGVISSWPLSNFFDKKS